MNPLAIVSALYTLVTDVRNWMFDHGWLHEVEYDIPVINVGNLAVGGTGKTPHTEWIARQLMAEGKRIAILSRGYRRKTRGYREADRNSTAADIGDEPLQMYLHLGHALEPEEQSCSAALPVIAVCEDRRKGIAALRNANPHLDAVLLDDAFQHRYVKPRLNILLTDYARLYADDHVMPWGRLREHRRGARRADAIVVTKCPPALTDEARQSIIDRLRPTRLQPVFFSAIDYAPLPAMAADDDVLLLTGIDHPQPIVEHLQAKGLRIVRHLNYPDHHRFSPSDISDIEQAAEQVQHIITTAKDNARLKDTALSQSTRSKIIVQEIVPRILFGQGNTLLQKIFSYVDTDKRNRSVD